MVTVSLRSIPFYAVVRYLSLILINWKVLPTDNKWLSAAGLDLKFLKTFKISAIKPTIKDLVDHKKTFYQVETSSLTTLFSHT